MDLILPGIYRITLTSRWGAFKPPANLYVLADPTDAILFDAGYGSPRDIRKVMHELTLIKKREHCRGRNFRLNRILPSHSHADHFSGASPLKKQTGAEILLTTDMANTLSSRAAYTEAYREVNHHPPTTQDRITELSSQIADALFGALFGIRYIPFPDRIVNIGDTFLAGKRTWELLSLPGHCNDHIGIYSADDGILLAGDHVLRTITPWLGPPRSSLTDYSATLYKLLQLPGLRCVLTAHGAPVWHPKQRIRELILHRENRTRQILSIVTAHPDGIGLNRIIRKQAGKGNLLSRYLGKGWIRLTLMHLESRGLIHRREETGDYVPAIPDNHCIPFPLIPINSPATPDGTPLK